MAEEPKVEDEVQPTEVVAGLSLPNRENQLKATDNLKGVVGGLSLPAGNQPEIGAEKTPQFDPISLINMDSVPIDQFFGLDPDGVYNSIRNLAIHRDPEIVRKANQIIKAITEGRDKYLESHPGATDVDLT